MTIATDFSQAARMAIIDAFEGNNNAQIVDIIKTAERSAPSSVVREMYWEMVHLSELEPLANGTVIRL